jgi:hypothetical protein
MPNPKLAPERVTGLVSTPEKEVEAKSEQHWHDRLPIARAAWLHHVSLMAKLKKPWLD